MVGAGAGAGVGVGVDALSSLSPGLVMGLELLPPVEALVFEVSSSPRSVRSKADSGRIGSRRSASSGSTLSGSSSEAS